MSTLHDFLRRHSISKFGDQLLIEMLELRVELARQFRFHKSPPPDGSRWVERPPAGFLSGSPQHFSIPFNPPTSILPKAKTEGTTGEGLFVPVWRPVASRFLREVRLASRRGER